MYMQMSVASNIYVDITLDIDNACACVYVVRYTSSSTTLVYAYTCNLICTQVYTCFIGFTFLST